MRLSTDDAILFEARARSASFGHVQLCDLYVRDPFVARRTKKLIAGSCPEYLKVGLQRSGVRATTGPVKSGKQSLELSITVDRSLEEDPGV
jgi:hypothetical protein